MRKLKGLIVSDAMQKTVVVRVDRLRKHPKYLKYYRISQRYKAHSEKGEYKNGDTVIIEETKPLSKEKRWNVIKLVLRPPEESAAEKTAEKNENEPSKTI